MFLFFLCLNLNSKNEYSNYKDPIWADAAGYYVYLPATFIYGWEPGAMPLDWPEKLGYGFDIDQKTGVLSTKYSVGVAIMELPFFLVAHGFALLNGNADGYSSEYHICLWMAGIFYLLMGLVFLKKYLVKRYDLKFVFVTLFFLLAGTNLYYYALNSSGMSHIYSFFLFSLMLWLADLLLDNFKLKYLLLFAFACSLCIVVRPTSLIYVVFLFFLKPTLFRIIIAELIRKPVLIVIVLLIAILPLVPQFIYWHYSSGNLLHYSYEEEGFDYLLNPQILKFWFSTKNGLFVITPMFVFALIGVFMMRKKNRLDSAKFIVLFLVFSYIFSAWHCWFYGCSYGSRNLVEYIVPFSIPFCLFVQQTFRSRFSSLRYLALTLAAVFVFINLKMIYKYDDCFHGDVWDWEAYYKLIF